MRVPTTTPVLIVGGGPVGLTLSVLLSEYGVDHLLAEARPGTSRHPKARGVSARSMEILRRCGLEDAVRQAGLPASQVFFYRGRDLVDPEFVRTGVPVPAQDGREPTPAPGLICSQDALERVLADRARRLAGPAVRFGTRLESFTERDGAVHAVLEDRATGRRQTVRAHWLIGCDGASSTVRTGAGIAMEGPTGLGHYLSIRFEAPLGPVVADRASASYFLTAPGRGGFMAVDNDRHWIYQHPFDPSAGDIDGGPGGDPAGNPGGDPGEPAAGRDRTSRLVALVRAAAGIPDLEVTVRDTMAWRMDARLAAGYRRSRVLLAGDAAHVVPPTGGHGMNTGIGDADNLAWKLAAVTAGRAADALLDTYEAERRPLARQVIDLSQANARARAGYRIDDELLLTAAYRSTAVLPDPGAADHASAGRSPLDPAGLGPDAAPGERAPHVRLTGADGITSTLDLAGHGFTLLTPAEAPAWRRQAEHAAAAGLPVTARTVTGGDRNESEPGSWAARCGIPGSGAVLVRPDGHLAWRATGPAPADTGHLTAVLRNILGIPGA
ncbi:FAD-dependent monooxygenase [Kitasatospora sp. MBT63]|uniref:FAD-dependent monooxygenase n=1 Tax=Kitasatospora sp. MBT63 TaxID=1444768 RepID=UPI00053BBB32|nr:FAD-dependent monooxygenase [Kitasatospora sp. MBT63]